MGLGATAVIGYMDEDGNWKPVTSGAGLPVSGGGGGGGGGGGAVNSVNGKTGEVVLNPPDLNFPMGGSVMGLLMSDSPAQTHDWITSRVRGLPGTEVQLGGLNLGELLDERVHKQNFDMHLASSDSNFAAVRNDIDALEDAIEDVPTPAEDMNEWGYVPTVVIPNGGTLPTPLPALGVVYELEEG